ncbi:hypothetical protein JMJ35_005699 [Cladonia borealis]|uniref:Protein kinase domain-containing protein n=1 Tax=Cladonia borealis TaxID=184061 RepID=A0AA39R1E3_9LECA|nr:hypothetical protein JMJ35_005699 [Cladonia borealis]
MSSTSLQKKETSDMRAELEDLEVQNYEQKCFIPPDALKNLLPESRVATIIHALSERGEIKVWQQPELIRIIVDNGLRVFATLLSFSQPGLIQNFLESDHFAHSQLDSRLPLSKDSLGLIIQNEKLSARFYKHQWKFLAPFFRAGQSHRELQDNVVLPFTKCERLGEGCFGEVHKMTMAAAHQSVVPEGGTAQVTIIRKQIRPGRNAQNDFRQEEHILSFLRCLEHPNIVQLLAAYTIQQTHYLLFPQADGDLKDFLRQENRIPGFQTDNEVFQALYELASAIEAVHNYFSKAFNVRKIGCHYDLKPDNILYRPGKLILSDFGLSRLRNEDEGSKSLYRNGGAEYWAPECHSVDEYFKKLHIGRSSDMWSFGCILSEMLTYLQEGSTGVKIFSSKRKVTLAGYFTCKLFHEGAKPSEAVTQWLSRLTSWPTITNSQKSLMVVIHDLLQHEPDARSRAQDITLSLYHIAQTDVYRTIEVQFQQLLVESDLEVEIEYQRFLIWGETYGFGDIERVLKTDSRQASESFANMQLTRDCVFELRREVDKVSAALKVSGPKPYKLCYHLQKVIDKLWDMQPSLVRESMTNTLESRILSTEDKNKLGSLEAAFQGPDACNSDHSSTPYRRIGLLAAMKQIASALEGRSQSSGNMLIDEGHITKPIKEFHWYGISTLHAVDDSERQILIEWLEYDGSWADRKSELIQRVQDITSFRALSSASHAFPVLTAAGFYHDVVKHSFGIVYYFPLWQPSPSPSIPDIEQPRSLRDIISNIRLRTQRPSLDQVFDTALKLVNVVLTMHKASWLHKSISSYNIIFFPNRFNSIADAMTEPYFIGFSYSRLNLETAFTQGPNKMLEYQHPEYLSGLKRFYQEYEYYSVGLVLLELGLWLPLEKITQGIRGNPTKMLNAILETEVPKLKTYMGSSYEEAVTTCLKGDFGGSSNPAEVRQAFEPKVLLKIKHPSR